MLSSIKNNKDLSALIMLLLILLGSCLVITPFQLYGQSAPANKFSDPNYLEYENANYNISLSVPSNWDISEDNNTIRFLSPLENGSDVFREGLTIDILSSGNIPVGEYASVGIIELRQSLENFTLNYSDANFTVSNYPAFKIIYSYINGTVHYEAMRIWAVIGRNTYTISHTAESNNYLAYLPVIETMIGSLRVESPENTGNDKSFLDTGGIVLRDSPYNMVVDASRNRVYVTDSRAGLVSVIDGQEDNILTDIGVGMFPSAIDIDPDSGRLFVTNKDSDTVSVIDGSTNRVIANISVGSRPADVVIDSNEEGSKSLIFVSSPDSDTVSVIDGSTNRVIANINVRQVQPNDLAVNPITNRLYVADSQNNTISVIDYYLSKNEELRNETIADIQVSDKPASIDFNPVTNRLYVSSPDSDTVSVIDGSTNRVIANISVGTSPYGIEVNTDENLIYVANYLSNTISVIDGSTNQVIKNIIVNRFPFVVSYNPVNKFAYVTHLTQNIVSIINNTDALIGVRFEINPADSGYVNCNGKDYSNGDYFRYRFNTTLVCSAVPNTRFSFSSWSGGLTSRPIPSSQTTFEASKFGNVTANFVVPVEFTLPKEYWDQLTVILISIIIPAIAGWSIPAIAGWINGRRQRRHLKEFIKSVDTRYKVASKEPINNPSRFDDIRTQIEDALSAGKINESQFNILNNKISEYLKLKIP